MNAKEGKRDAKERKKEMKMMQRKIAEINKKKCNR